MTIFKSAHLGEIITISKGKKHAVADEVTTDSTRVIGIDDLRNDNLVRSTNDKAGIEAVPEDVLIAWDGANAGTIGYGKTGFIGSTIARLRIKDRNRFFTPFLGVFLQSKFDYLRKTATGATIPHINRQALEGIVLPEINFDDQKRIAHLLGKVEWLIAQRKQHMQQLDDLLKSVFLEMFGDPVRNEKGHKLSVLGPFITHLTSGGRGWAKYYSPSGKRFIRSLDVQMNRIGSDDIAYVNPPRNKETERTRVRPGDVLLTITGSKIGRVCYVPDGFEEAYVSQHVAIIRTQSINPIYLSYYMSMPSCGQRTISKEQYGQAKPGLNLAQISNFKILEPDPGLQDHFANIVETNEVIRSHCEQSLIDLEQLYGALSQKAFKGELDLSQVLLQPTTGDLQLRGYAPSVIVDTVREQRKTIDLPDVKNMAEALATIEGRQRILHNWLEAYAEQLRGAEFSVNEFLTAAQLRMTELFPDDDYEIGLSEYKHLKDWVFAALDNGRLHQSRNIIGRDENGDPNWGNRVTLQSRARN